MKSFYTLVDWVTGGIVREPLILEQHIINASENNFSQAAELLLMVFF